MGSHTPTGRARTAPAADARAALDALRRIVQALRLSATQAERQTGLSGAQLFVLQQLAEARGQSLNDLARRTRTHQSSVSIVVTRLVSQGLVSRRRAPDDGRRLVLDLTTRGRTLLADAPATAQSRLIAGLDRLPRPALRALVAQLESLVAALGMETQPAGLFFESPAPSGKPGPSAR
jgi:MarR family transcriptional regulator, lower aerobic nicotinate degradation pathway regulator